MNPAADDTLLDYLAEYDEALAEGRQPRLALPDLPAAEQVRWRKAVAVVDLLHRYSGAISLHSRATVPVQAGTGEIPLPGWVGRYVVERELGRGGMGVVYQAWDPDLGRRVALKVVQEPDEERRARFLNEAGSLARLQHPHIVQVFEVGESEGVPYLVMEYVPGRALKVGADESLLTPIQVASMLARVARAIQYAHEQGIIHRDIKPSNILVTPDGVPKVTDFGLAKRIDASLDLTRSGAVLGTPNYMAPEQADGRDDRNSPAIDVYGLGATLYALLTGRPPFLGLTAFFVMQQLVNEEPPAPRLFNPQLPLDLETICLKCLEKEPTRRYGSAGELADDLERYLAGLSVRARPVSVLEKARRWCGRNRVLTTLATGLLLVLLAGITATSLLAAWALHERDGATTQRNNAFTAQAEAAEQAEIAAAVRDFLQDDLILQASPNLQAGLDPRPDWKLTFREVLDRAAPRIPFRFAGRPRVEAAVQESVGRTYIGLGVPAKASPHLQRAVELTRQTRGADHVDLIAPLTALAMTYQMNAQPTEQLSVRRELLGLLRLHKGELAEVTLQTANTVGGLEAVVGDAAAGVALLEETVKRAEASAGSLGLLALQVKTSLALLPPRANRPDLVARYRQELIDAPLTEQAELFHPDQGPVLLMIEIACMESNRFDRALALSERALQELRRLEPGSLLTLDRMQGLGRQYRQGGRFADAVPLFREARGIWSKDVKPGHTQLLTFDAEILECLLGLGQAEQGDALSRELLAARERGGASPGDLGWALTLRGWCLLQRNKPEDAQGLLEMAWKVLPADVSEPTRQPWARSLLGQTLLARKNLEGAEPHLLAAFDGLQPGSTGVGQLGQYYREQTRVALVALYEARGQPDRARTYRDK
jgi:tetratricopeptide (TPR) repeat protein/predicted Ser/Thr protein kinase